MDIVLMLNLLLVAVLIVLTAFFVGSEFAVVKVRMSRIEQLITEGNKTAVIVKKLVNDLDYYLSACQLGITVTALGLGWLGKPAVEQLILPAFNFFDVPDSVTTIISFAAAFSIVTFLHVVIGELAPKTLAIQFAERMTLILARPLYWFGKIMYPAIWFLNGSARMLLRSFGVKPAGHEQAHSEEELKIIMAESYQSGEINETELSYLERIFTFDERVAKDIMVPRTQIVTLDKSMTIHDVLDIVEEHQYTRYPVTTDNNRDELIGFVNVKEMLTNFTRQRNHTVSENTHDILLLNEHTPIQTVMQRMQKDRIHIATVLDEYGGTAGLITMEDILEEIVGEIRDEFDHDEQAEIEEIGELTYRINGRVLLDELSNRFGITFDPDQDIDTIAGWLYSQENDLYEGFTSETNDYLFKIEAMENHQILTIIMKKVR